MTPGSSRVFLIGFNQATPLPASIVEHDDYLDALFNRNGRSIAKLYEEVRGKGSSDTRQNIDHVTALLRDKGITDVLETNVVCYATPKSSKGLQKREHSGGELRGKRIFAALLDEIRPPVLLAHGARTRKELAKALQCALRELPELPRGPDDEIPSRLIETNIGVRGYRAHVFLIPSLAPPAWDTWPQGHQHKWHQWAWPYVKMVCERIHQALQSRG